MDILFKKIFSKSFIRTLLNKGIPDESLKIIEIINKDLDRPNNDTLFDFFENCFLELSKDKNRIEYFYKNTLINKYIFGTHNPKTSTVIHELSINKSKADIALITKKTFSIFEIKSERDSLSKLKNQIDDYFKVCPLVYVISAEKHISKILEVTNNKTGILLCSRNNQITKIREAEIYKDQIIKKEFVKIFNKSESLAIIKDLKKTNYAQYNSTHIHEEISSYEYFEILKSYLKIAISSRNINSKNILFENWPPSLYSFLTSTKLNSSEIKNLKRNLFTPINHLEKEQKYDISKLLQSKAE